MCLIMVNKVCSEAAGYRAVLIKGTLLIIRISKSTVGSANHRQERLGKEDKESSCASRVLTVNLGSSPH